MNTEFSATDEPPKEMPPKPELPRITPGASSATEVRLWSTGIRASSSRLMLVAVSVEKTSTRLMMRLPTTSIASRLATPPSAPRLTVVVPPSDTLTVAPSPTGCPLRSSCRR